MENVILLNEKKFLIVSEVDYNDNHYIYAGSLEDEKFALLIEKEENGVKTVESVTDEEEFVLIMGIIAKENN